MTPQECGSRKYVAIITSAPIAGFMLGAALWNLVCEIRGWHTLIAQPQLDDTGYRAGVWTATTMWGLLGPASLAMTALSPCSITTS